ncbi:MAG TPA: ribonuclease G, partial [Burkholderiaceae bacterium]|nr:ribonuclease G [Burkholderiaceae bacterium]
MQDILINWSPQETRVAVVEGGAVQELHVERTLERGLVGNIYTGRVARVLPGMQSAFIDIGLERAAFLHVADVFGSGMRGPHAGEAGAPPLPIEKQVFEGQSLMVQVIKDPIGTKGARLSTQISVAGRLLVYLPQDDHIGISQKIGSGELRDQLRTRMAALVGRREDGGGGGFILRTNAEEANDAELAEDIAYLRKTWGGIREAGFKQPPGVLLHQDLNLAQRVLRDLVNDQTHSIRIDSRLQFEELREFGRHYTPTAVGKLQHYTGERPIFDLYNVDEEIQRALARRVDLKSGGYVVIDQTEALTTVDVNTGGYVGARNFDDTIFKTNLEATQAIARQLRLRNLGGIIIIDFIDMQDEAHRRQVLAALERALAGDRAQTHIVSLSPLGLVEMTRKRTRESLEHLLCRPCPSCDGRGFVKTPETVCHEIFREIVRQSRQFASKELLILAHRDVVDRLLDEESPALAELEPQVGRPIRLQAEALYGVDQY